METTFVTPPSPENRTLKVKRGLTVGVVLLATACATSGDKGSFETPSPTLSVGPESPPPTASASANIIPSGNCIWSKERRQPLASANPARVSVYGFCFNNPEDPSLIFSQTAYNETTVIAHADNGALLEVAGCAEGGPVRDGLGTPAHTSTDWLKINLTRSQVKLLPSAAGKAEGWIPTTYTGFTDPKTIEACK